MENDNFRRALPLLFLFSLAWALVFVLIPIYLSDLGLNGYEIGGGSIRITNSKIQEKVFKILGHTEKEIKQKFGHLLEAFEYGVPPHGGIAPGIDRFLFVVLREPNLREVMAFPTIASGKTSVMDAPSEISKEQLKELSIEISKKKKVK